MSDVIVKRGDETISVVIGGAVGPIGLDLVGTPEPGQFVVFNADREVQGASGTGADAGLRTDLAAPSGSALTGYDPGGEGSALRSIQSKARETVSVRDYGAVGGGEVNDTAAFNAAIATGRKVIVPHDPVGYLVEDIDVFSNMEIVGEKNGMSAAPRLIVKTSGKSAFLNSVNDNVFHCTFENLRCDVAPGVTNASFIRQTTQGFYSAYFTFRNIETYKSLRASYVGLFIFALWDRCRDGYLGDKSDIEHSSIIALAGAYGQTNQQNINRVTNTMFFGSFGGQASIVASYGILFTFDNVNFEALETSAVKAYNIFQLRFSNTWFEGGFSDLSVVDVANYPNTIAASSAYFEHCNFVFSGNTAAVINVENPGTVAFRRCMFNLVPVGMKLCNDGTRVTINEDNIAVSGAGAAGMFVGMHQDTYSAGRRLLNGAADNGITDMTLQNEGGVTATDGFLSRAAVTVGTTFVTVATSRTGLGGTVTISGADTAGGLQFRMVKDWQGTTVRDVVAPLNATTKTVTFRVVGNDLQMKVDSGTVSVFTTMQH